MNDRLKTFNETANRVNPEWVRLKAHDGGLDWWHTGGEDMCGFAIDLANDHASADAIIVILDAIRARGYTVQILTFADSVAEPDERFQVFAWRSLNEHRKGPNDGNSAAGPTLIGCAVEVYNAIHAGEEANNG